jgi:Mitogen-activated protein kinase kinase 1 interacting
MAASVGLLPYSLQSALKEILNRANKSGGCIRVILLSTAEGVPLARVYADTSQPLSEDVLSAIESIWAPASKQCPMLNMGKEVKTVTAIYDHGILLHVYQVPLVLTILGSPLANIGVLRSTAIPLLKEVLEPLCSTLLNSLAPGRDYTES